MATKMGPDVILTLMSNVAELQQGQEEMTTHLETMVKLSRAQAGRLDRVAQVLNQLADAVADHEARISALESHHP